MADGTADATGTPGRSTTEGAVERLQHVSAVPALFNGERSPETTFADIANAVAWCTGAFQASPCDASADAAAFAKSTLPSLVEVLLRRKTLRYVRLPSLDLSGTPIGAHTHARH